jgi:DNA-binding PadR family transcriptional regulator
MKKPLPAAPLHIVLALLDGEQHGYAIMRNIEEMSGGAVRMGPGTLYGLIVETTDRVERDDHERRRYYQLTGEGRSVALAELERLQSLVRRVGVHLPGGATA